MQKLLGLSHSEASRNSVRVCTCAWSATPTCYTWKRCEVSSLRKREPSRMKWTCVWWCVHLQMLRYRVYSWCCHGEEVQYNIRYLCFLPYKFPSLTIVVLSYRSTHQCTTIRGCNTNLIVFL